VTLDALAAIPTRPLAALMFLAAAVLVAATMALVSRRD
jgi:hypothetical protein